MSIQRFLENVSYNEDGVAVTVMSSDEVSKEIRIVFKAGQVMEKHNAPYPISVMTLKGSIKFGYDGTSVVLGEGDMIKLDASVMHDLLAEKDSVVQLTLSQMDTIARVESVRTR